MATYPVSYAPTLDLALLGFLQTHAMHAYDIHQALSKGSGLGLLWNLKQSHLYAVLNRLEERGYLCGEIEQQGSKPPRRMLRLTIAGRQAFEAWLAAPVEHGRDFRQTFLAKLYFTVASGMAQEILQRQRVACEGWLANLPQTAAPAATFDDLIWQFRVGQIQAILAWLDGCALALERGIAFPQ